MSKPKRCPRCKLKDEGKWTALYFSLPACTFEEGCDWAGPEDAA